jgi:hypothetical protein
VSDFDVKRENELRRERFCIPLDRDPLLDEPFFCSLGTLWCSEAHGDFEIAWADRRGEA